MFMTKFIKDTKDVATSNFLTCYYASYMIKIFISHVDNFIFNSWWHNICSIP